MDIIGKRIRVQIGGNPPEPDNNVIIGDDTLLHVSSSEASKYRNIVGEKIEVVVSNPDSIVRQIHDAIQKDSHPLKEKIAAECKEILRERDITIKRSLIQALINNAANIASISSFIIQLSQIRF